MEDVQGIGYGSFLRCQAALLVFFIRFDLFSSVSLVCSFPCRNICLEGGGCGLKELFGIPFFFTFWEVEVGSYIGSIPIARDDRELKQTRRRRKWERHLKTWPGVSAIIFQLLKLIMLKKCVLTILELNWKQRLGHKQGKLNICHHMLTSSTQLQNRSFHVVERTKTSSKCQKMKNARAKRAKIQFYIVKYANLWGFCCRRRRGCLSSLISLWRRQTIYCLLKSCEHKTKLPACSCLSQQEMLNYYLKPSYEYQVIGCYVTYAS